MGFATLSHMSLDRCLVKHKSMAALQLMKLQLTCIYFQPKLGTLHLPLQQESQRVSNVSGPQHCIKLGLLSMTAAAKAFKQHPSPGGHVVGQRA